jgi:hypothetical protein
MATRASIEVHRRPEALAGAIGFFELRFAPLEERELAGAQAGDRITGVRGADAHSGIARHRIQRGRGFDLEEKRNSNCGGQQQR